MAEPIPAVIGRFLVSGLVEETARSCTYRGVHELVGEPVLITRERSPRPADPGLRELLVAEARRRASLPGRHLGRFFELDLDQDRVFVVEADVPGRRLSDRLAKGPATPSELGRWLGPIADELAAAHQAGVVHGAIDASRVVLREDGPAVLTGWGAGWLGGGGELRAADDQAALERLLPGLRGQASRAAARAPDPARTGLLVGWILGVLVACVVAYLLARG